MNTQNLSKRLDRAPRRLMQILAMFALLFCISPAGAQQTVGQTATATPAAPPNFLEQLESALTGLVNKAQSAIVSIEVRMPPIRMIPRPQFPADLEKLPPEKRAEHEKDLKNAEEALRNLQQDIEIPLAQPRTGSGFLIKGGYVVTTSEVVAGMKEQPVITLSDGRRLKALRTNTHKSANIAVLKVEVAPEIGLQWGDSEKIAAGNLALTIGNQAGFANSASLGLIAGVNRAGASGGIRYDNLIQFQGVVGVGGSGSPLLNMRGEVIGMVVATPAGAAMQRADAAEAPEKAIAVRRAPRNPALDRAGFRVGQADTEAEKDPEPQARPAQRAAAANVFFFGGLANTGFAIPKHDMKPIVELLMKDVQPPQVGWMGVLVDEPTGEDKGKGVLLSRVYIDRPADRAELQRGDLVTAVNGKPVRSKEDMKRVLQNVLSGQAIRLEIKRGTMTLTRTLITEPKPSEAEIKELPFYEIP